MIAKKLVPLTGRLLFPLEEGCKAVIAYKGGFIQTSRVVEILETEQDHVLFETMNSVYRVSLAPVPNEAALPQPLAMCA